MSKAFLTLPAYNEAECVGPLLDRASAVFKGQDWQAEVILVDDGSTDGTADAARAANCVAPVMVVTHEQNMGLGHAIKTCLREALSRCDADDDIIVCMDSDDTHPPDVIPGMVEKIQGGADLVIASRYQPGSKQVGVPLFRLMLSFGARWLFHWKLGIKGVRDYTCGFRAYRASLIRQGLEKYGDEIITREGFACTDELLVKLAHFKPVIAEVPFTLRYDQKHGKSKIQLIKTIRETLKMLWKD